MDKNEFLETFKGQNNRYRNRSLNSIWIPLEEKPFSKGKKRRNSKNKETIKRILSAIPLRKHSFRKEVACHLMFCSNDKTLPQIYKLAKNYIYLINKTWIKENIANFPKNQFKRIPLTDDRQISYLSINHLATGQNISMLLRRFNHFLADACFAYHIKNGKFNGKHEKMATDSEDKVYGCINLDFFYRLIAYKQDYFLKKYTYLLRKGELTFHGVTAPDLYSDAKSLSGVVEKWISQFPRTIKLQPIPGSVDAVAKMIKIELKKLQDKYPKSFVSGSPMHVQIIYKPFTIIKDLDNLACLVLPILQKVVKPNYSSKVYEIGNKTIEVNEQSVPLCELIKLTPAYSQDESFMVINFRNIGTLKRSVSLWDEVYNIIGCADEND